MARTLIIGGSLGGLFAGLTLRQAGWDVMVFERWRRPCEPRRRHRHACRIVRGDAPAGDCGRRVDGRAGNVAAVLDRDRAVIARLAFEKILSSWARYYRALRRLLPDACYRPGMQLEDATQAADGVTAIFADGCKTKGDIMIGADGLHSTVRGRLFPDAMPRYAGYIAWRGVIEEGAIPAAARELRESYSFFLPAREMVLSYLQPGADDDHRPGKRRLNWLWYHPTGATALA
jgi:2-polyprenyl-6-methoxyphenol hydroxylase-like FAD-dependent oxidoreductase